MNDKEYSEWIGGIARRYRQSQVKAATAVNVAMLKFYWSLGADIVRLEKNQPWGSKFMQRVGAEKIKRLYKAAEANGFASYAEA